MRSGFADYQYHALICNPDLITRNRLKTACSAIPRFGRIGMCEGLTQAAEVMSGEIEFNVVFISDRIPQDEITNFIKTRRGTKQGQDAAYIIVNSASTADNSSIIAQNMLIGADGFLFEPFSIDSLVEITELAKTLKRDRAREREAAALTFVLNDIIPQIDLIAQLKSTGLDMGPNLKRLREMCTIFKTLTGESFSHYAELAEKKFGAASVPVVGKKKYAGVSDRVKKRLEEKHREELARKAGSARPDKPA